MRWSAWSTLRPASRTDKASQTAFETRVSDPFDRILVAHSSCKMVGPLADPVNRILYRGSPLRRQAVHGRPTSAPNSQPCLPPTTRHASEVASNRMTRWQHWNSFYFACCLLVLNQNHCQGQSGEDINWTDAELPFGVGSWMPPSWRAPQDGGSMFLRNVSNADHFHKAPVTKRTIILTTNYNAVTTVSK
jgi:hypothetical protein